MAFRTVADDDLRIASGSEPVLARFAVFEIAYLIAYRFGMSFSQESASPFWFPDAVLLSALLVSERRRWWLYLLGSLPIRLFLFADPGLPLWFLLACFVNDSLKALLSGWVLSSLARVPVWFESLRDFLRYFLIAALISPALSAFAGAASRLYLGDTYWAAWRNWFLGDALASIILTPLLVTMITLKRKPFIATAGRLTEGLVATIGLLGASYLAFQSGLGGFPPFLLYLPVPFLLWATVRFDSPGAPVSLLLMSVPAIFGTMAGRGPFYLQSPAQSLVSIQLFLFAVSVPFMFLSVLTTQQRKTAGALRESEGRFRYLVDAGPIMVWMSGLHGLCTFVNKPWLDYTGRTMTSQLGNGWTEGVHPEDRESLVNQYFAAFCARKSFTLDYRLLRHDGSYRWVVNQGVPRYDPDGGFLGYVGSCVDMTDRREIENRLRHVSVQITRAQETERSRIAQELHDDLSQRTVVLSMKLHSISRKYPENPDLLDEVHKLQQAAADLGKDMARLARQLHSGIVEKVGLLRSLSTLCQQSGSDGHVVTFVCVQEPPPLGGETTLALYRVAQEALRNALTHSGASHVSVELRTAATTIQLVIKDNGCGFAVSVATSGLGLSGMTERIKNVGGSLNIVSRSGNGTTVTATVAIANTMIAAKAD